MTDCGDLRYVRQGQVEIPNCRDPVFRAWCSICGVKPGGRYGYYDERVRRLEEMMAEDYDPFADVLDDPFQSELF